MKNIDIEFVNIQSHEHTKFHLRPGLNFILAEDNNVGKSTIFKVIVFAMQLPKVDGTDANELIRGGCTSAKAVFIIEGIEYTLWLFREGGKQVRAFFETKDPDGLVTRSLNAPADLKAAFDIVISNDGKVINFNDADSIQLVVQDTPKNDEVLSRVLIDLRVENIKVNAARLSQEASTDYRIVKARYEQAEQAISTMRYCDTVGIFNTEYPQLAAGCRVLDAIGEPCSCLVSATVGHSVDELEILSRVTLSLIDLEGLRETTHVDLQAYESVLSLAETANRVCLALSEAASKLRKPLPSGTSEAVDVLSKALPVLETTSKGLAAMSRAFNNGSRANTMSKEIEELNKLISDMAQRVQCPIKGEVFYTNEECIPVSD